MMNAIVKDLPAILTAVVGLVTATLGIFKYFQYQSKRDKVALVRQNFDAVVRSLASSTEVERMSGAILLRRFCDPDSEVGIAGTPYWKEAVSVSAAILRGQATGNFQKLLADGLAFAPTLERADLQKTNLQFAYLGLRTKSSEPGDCLVPNLKEADFYRSDLSGASLKRADARGAVFYQARLHGTVFTGADLRNANFYEADLKGALFRNARLEGASFERARNVPGEVVTRLDEKGVYRHVDPFVAPGVAQGTNHQPRIFVSKPGCLDSAQAQYLRALFARLQEEGLTSITLERTEYPHSGALSEVGRRMSDCSGAVILGFKQLEVRYGMWRPGTTEHKVVEREHLPTPWNQIEAGIATILGLPLLIVSQSGVGGGIFDLENDERHVYRVLAEQDPNTIDSQRAFSDWSADVRERALRS